MDKKSLDGFFVSFLLPGVEGKGKKRDFFPSWILWRAGSSKGGVILIGINLDSAGSQVNLPLNFLFGAAWIPRDGSSGFNPNPVL